MRAVCWAELPSLDLVLQLISCYFYCQTISILFKKKMKKLAVSTQLDLGKVAEGPGQSG